MAAQPARKHDDEAASSESGAFSLVPPALQHTLTEQYQRRCRTQLLRALHDKGKAAERASLLSASPMSGSAQSRNSISLDQLLAKHLGDQTRFPSLVLSLSGSNSPAYTENGAMIPAEDSPSRLFMQLFVDESPAERAHHPPRGVATAMQRTAAAEALQPLPPRLPFAPALPQHPDGGIGAGLGTGGGDAYGFETQAFGDAIDDRGEV